MRVSRRLGYLGRAVVITTNISTKSWWDSTVRGEPQNKLFLLCYRPSMKLQVSALVRLATLRQAAATGAATATVSMRVARGSLLHSGINLGLYFCASTSHFCSMIDGCMTA